MPLVVVADLFLVLLGIHFLRQLTSSDHLANGAIYRRSVR